MGWLGDEPVRWRAVVLCVGLGACAVARTTPEAPNEAIIAAAVKTVFAETKLPGTPEISRIRAAHVVSPGDWIVCLKSSDPEKSLRYALFFTDKFVASKLAALVDRCDEETYL